MFAVTLKLKCLQSRSNSNVCSHAQITLLRLFVTRQMTLTCTWGRRYFTDYKHSPKSEMCVIENIVTHFFISVINQLDAQTFLFYNKFISCLYMFRAHVLIIRRSKLHYTASGIITLKQVSGLKLLKYNSRKYQQIVVKFMCEFFGCDYCVLFPINILIINQQIHLYKISH